MRLRAVVVGAGVMGSNHIRAVAGLDGVDLVGVVDESGFEGEHNNVVQRFTSTNSLPGKFADFAIVATPTQTHASVTADLFERGINVLVEKPIAHSFEAAQTMLRARDQSGLIGAVGHIERFNPSIQQLKAHLQSNALGEVYQIATRRQGSFPNRISDVGVVKDLATHDIDLVSWVTGSEYEVIFSLTKSRQNRGNEDLAVSTGRLRNGVVVSHINNWLSPIKERVVTVIGERGSLVADTLTGDLTLYETGAFSIAWPSFSEVRGVAEGRATRMAYPRKEPLVAELEGFRDAVSLQGVQIVTFEEGIRTLVVAEAMLESQAQAKPITLSQKIKP